jgi:tetratricopeptide (TPR) repeat protein
MKNIITNGLFACACMMMITCGKNNTDKVLDRVENIIFSWPDSAKKLLDSIANPFGRTHYQNARRVLFTLYVNDFSDEDITRDTIIVWAKNYLKITGDTKYLALAEYCTGRVYQEQGNNEQAMLSYSRAKTNIKDSDNDCVKGLIHFRIGYQYYIRGEHDDAINDFKAALEYFKKLHENHKRKIAVLNIMGNCFLMKGQKDSAMICYGEALGVAPTSQDSCNIMQNLGAAYININEPDEAKRQLFRALSLKPNVDLQGLIYLNLGNVYRNENIPDSAVYFAKLSLKFVKKNNNHALPNIYNILSTVEEKKKNYKKAHEYYMQYANCLRRIDNEKHNSPNMQLIETKHNLDILQNENNNLRTKIQWFSLYIFISAVFIVLFSIYLRLSVNKVNEYKKNVADLKKKYAESEMKYAESEKKLSDFVEEKEQMLSRIISKIGKKTALFRYSLYLRNNKISNDKFLEIMNVLIPKNEKDNLYDDINTLYNDVFNRMNIKSKGFSEFDLEIICLTCAGLDNTDIAKILNLTDKHVIERANTNIRKILKIDTRGDIKVFFQNYK